ncbi:hypothetical protein D3C86_1750510 [compost metagenome]
MVGIHDYFHRFLFVGIFELHRYDLQLAYKRNENDSYAIDHLGVLHYCNLRGSIFPGFIISSIVIDDGPFGRNFILPFGYHCRI